VKPEAKDPADPGNAARISASLLGWFRVAAREMPWRVDGLRGGLQREIDEHFREL